VPGILDYNPYHFVNKPNRLVWGHTQESRGRATPARFESGMCQNCGAVVDEFQQWITWKGVQLLVYGRECTKCKRSTIVRYGERAKGKGL